MDRSITGDKGAAFLVAFYILSRTITDVFMVVGMSIIWVWTVCSSAVLGILSSISYLENRNEKNPDRYGVNAKELLPGENYQMVSDLY